MSNGSEVRFNLQQYLEDMRREQADAHRALTGKVDEGFKEVGVKHANLDKRVDRIESSQSRVRWFVGTAIGIGALVIAWLKG